MTEDSARTSSRVGQLLDSDRAMIPLALIGVFLLLSSVLIVGYVETRAEPEPNVDASLALDTTEASVQTVLRDSSQRAATTAAAQPVTEPADTEWGDVLDRSEGQFAADPFENYLRALIYLELNDDLALAEQERGEIETNVTLPAVDSPREFGDAIERVDIDNSGTELTVSISNVTVIATHAGEVIEQRETTVEATVFTPVMQLHDRVSEYQYALDEATLMERGFPQRFNARTYAIGWARGWAQNYHAPVGSVLANRHIEPAVNSAVYRTQQDIFGAADPNLHSAVRLGWTCMGLKDGKALFDEYMSERGGMEYASLQHNLERTGIASNDSSGASVSADAGGLCSGSQLLSTQTTDDPPESPDVMELIGGANPLEENETLEVGELASLPLTELADSTNDASFANATQRIFTIAGEVSADARSTGELELDVGCELGYRGGSVSRDGTYDVSTTVRNPVAFDDERYYEYESTIRVSVTAERTCYERDGNGTTEKRDTDSYVIDLTTTVGEKTDSPSAKIDELNPLSDISPSAKYQPTDWRGSQFANYQNAGKNVTASILGSTSTESHERWLDERMSNTNYERAPPGDRQFETTEAVELDYETLLDGFKLTAEMMEDIIELQETAADVSVEFDRREMVTDNPTSLLLDELEAKVKNEYIDESASHEYENVGEKALYEARYLYYLTLVEQLEGLETAHDEAIGSVDERIAGAGGSPENTTRALTQGIRAEQPAPPSLGSSNLTDTVSYEVSGSPTYLLSEQTVDTDSVPPVDQDVEFAPLKTRNENAIDMPYNEVTDGPLSTVMELMPGVSGSPDAELTLRMAGDVLAAGELAVEAHEGGRQSSRDDAYLTDVEEFESDVTQFETNVADALEEFETAVAAETVITLYPSPATECLVYEGSMPNDRSPDWQTCAEALSEHGDLDSVVPAAQWAVEDAVARALAPYDTAETALLIGQGNATEYIVENVTSELSDPEYRGYDGVVEQHDDGQWNHLVNSAVRSAVMTASATSVEVGSVDQAEALDERIQEALGEATTDVVEERVAGASEPIGETVGERWLGDSRGSKHRAARVPAGVPLLPIPGQWVATVNAWTVEVAGEYARFEVSTNAGTPAHGTETTYVREALDVSHEIAGEQRELGAVEPIAFDSRTTLVVITPPGVGVGDRDGENPECSPTYPHVGEVDPDDERPCTDQPLTGDNRSGSPMPSP